MQNISAIKQAVCSTMSARVLFFMVLAAASVQTNAQDAAPDVDAGQALYLDKGCYACHSNVGQGWAGGKRIAEPVLPLAAFEVLIRKPNGSMPAYSKKVLSDNELEQIHQYLASLKSPNVNDIPLLRDNK